MKVAVFGAGTMGSGIAQVFAAKGHTALMLLPAWQALSVIRTSWLPL